MTTVVERSQQLVARLVAAERVQKLQDQAEELEKRRQELLVARTAFQVMLARAQVLVRHDVLDRGAMPDMSGTLHALGKVKAKLADEPRKLTSGRDYRNLLEGAQRGRRELEAEVTGAWQAVVEAADPVDQRLLDRLGRVPGQEGAVASVEQARDSLLALRASPPESNGDWLRFRALEQKLKEGWAALDTSDLPDDVVAFLQQAQSPQGAPEVLWTTEVRAWFDKHGMLSGVRLHLRGER